MAPANNNSNKQSEQHSGKSQTSTTTSQFHHVFFFVHSTRSCTHACTFIHTSTRNSLAFFNSEGCCVFENSNIKITNWKKKNIVQNCYELVCLFQVTRSEWIQTAEFVIRWNSVCMCVRRLTVKVTVVYIVGDLITQLKLRLFLFSQQYCQWLLRVEVMILEECLE